MRNFSRHCLALCIVAGALLALPAQAHRMHEPVPEPQTGNNVDAMVSLDGWSGAGSSRTPPCSRCCIYQNENYSEGALLKVDGGTMQCTRDPQVVGTNDLIWLRVK
ncbi:MAG: DUF1496 domain-containing protein [Yersiniaceae bacterium]|nr:DUF1496 domain-containing protein [Yersiniaceae bacterium]